MIGNSPKLGQSWEGKRKIIYTTNPIEGFNRVIRKATKNKSSFPTIKGLEPNGESVGSVFWRARNETFMKMETN